MPSPLRHNPVYRRLYLANLLSGFGSQASAVALPLLVLGSFRHAFYLGLIGLVEAAAAICASPAAGLLVDRVRIRTVLLVSDLGRAIATGLIAVLVATGEQTIGMILVLTAVIVALGVPFQPAVLVTLRNVVPPEQMSTVLAVTQARWAIAGILGPLAGAAMFGLNPVVPFLLDAATFVVSAQLILRLRLGATNQPTQLKRVSSATKPRDLMAGLIFLVTDPAARYVTVMVIVIDAVFSGVFISLVATNAARSGSLGTGALFAATCLGNLLGSMIVLPLLRTLGSRTVARVLPGALALVILILSWAPTPAWRMVLVGCCCLATPFFFVVAQKTVLTRSPAELTGRVQAAFALMPQIAVPLGPLISTSLLSYFSLPTVVAVLDAALVCFALFGLLGRSAQAIPADIVGRPDRKAVGHLSAAAARK